MTEIASEDLVQIRERQARVEGQMGTLDASMGQVNAALQSLTANLAARPEPKPFGDTAKTAGVLLTIVATLIAALWTTIRINTSPVEDAVENIQMDVTESLRQGIESRVRLEDIRRRLSIVEANPPRVYAP